MSDNEQPPTPILLDVKCSNRSCKYTFTLTSKLGGTRCPECGTKYNFGKLSPKAAEKLKLKNIRKLELEESKEKEKERKKKEADQEEECLEYVNSKINKGIDYVSLKAEWIEGFEIRFRQILRTPLSNWSKNQREFYLTFRNYPGRKEYFDCILKADPTSSATDKKLDAIIKILAESVKGREYEMKEIQKRLGDQLEAQAIGHRFTAHQTMMDMIE
jgi:hypothetical protein